MGAAVALRQFDLQLDPSFQPGPIDGEVADFRLVPIEEVRRVCVVPIARNLGRHGRRLDVSWLPT
eukprot:1869250-Prymnesium_polylepis.1